MVSYGYGRNSSNQETSETGKVSNTNTQLWTEPVKKQMIKQTLNKGSSQNARQSFRFIIILSLLIYVYHHNERLGTERFSELKS